MKLFKPSSRVSVLFVCMGNICRSPTAEGVFRRLVEQAGLRSQVLVDSAGTHDYHVGEPPDERAQQHAARRGYDLRGLRARQVCARDFERFDLLLAMDWANLAVLEAACPPEHRHKLRRLMEFATRHRHDVVPDPYYGGPQGFETVLDYLEDACAGLLTHLLERRVLVSGTS
ncbi:low molecular weight phosphotyrosine protein phosphatase [Caldimonas thermodepolymerans]|jgi:Protein-tyrosine-phosphatase|uniref:protein-tyrosine-phosphatase n=1 Tax=Caldimonas thermodepolymerans TaxID=215580 RepID=A0A2S5T2H0_9BURK|nr:low molecular weight protein-tyrosine-phosphatase [Caldimonas thermodepolymerans]PPE69180.1 phosphotyrosine protein phosphatase [Caldimonas thermodepolymerans]QPC32914.1 low molecular weight phosphotyrosine protein phosphatase [Caldimonas thermodepolymerans]RDI03692.1 protein tyrosine phosphatase [Caldimonas thermodepolymerans]TCP09661.1 protein tyrosine phosphatase [Caldimonas thermodepolymerans]UZG45784.1 low molecular weight phosphotyrosine protein phosphatase [Caldimonas thermodepolymer